MRAIRAPSPWRYSVLVFGEAAPLTLPVDPESTLAQGEAASLLDCPLRRLRVLEAPAVALAALSEAVRLSGGDARWSGMRQSGSGPGKIGDGCFAGSTAVLKRAAARIQQAHPDLAASLLHAMGGFEAGRPHEWVCAGKTFSPAARPLIMGVLNLTPDSFSDGGRFVDPGAAEEAAYRMVEEGADLVDLGGESTRPGSLPVSLEEELGRVMPVLERIGGKLPAPISVDTSKAEVARRALDLGATVINDITAGTGDAEMLALVARSRAGLVLMHIQGTPATMQQNPHYEDLVREVYLFLQRRVRVCVEAGIEASRIVVDPGIGFGKSHDHNLSLIARLREFTSLGLPVLVGPSRKGFLGRILDLPPADRAEGTAAACTASVLNGASILRVHDVKPVARAVKVAAAVERAALQG